MVETIRLESGHTLTGIVGSNPTLSAILFVVILRLDSGFGWDCGFGDWGYLTAWALLVFRDRALAMLWSGRAWLASATSAFL